MSSSVRVEILSALCVGAAVGAAIGYVVAATSRSSNANLTTNTKHRDKKVKPFHPIGTTNASPAGGHYSQAVRSGGELFVSGILPITKDGVKKVDAMFKEQAELVMDNIEAILLAGGSRLSDLISVRCYITDIEDWGTFNKVYIKRMGSHRPARCVVPVPFLHHDFKLEVEAVARVVS